MSRIAKQPLILPEGVQLTTAEGVVTITGKNGTLKLPLHPSVELTQEEQRYFVRVKDKTMGVAMAGTTRVLLGNMITGVSVGFEKKLSLVGVGYRAKMKGAAIELSLGYSHPVHYEAPEGVELKVPSNNEIIVRGADKQLVGQVAANIRAFRKPEPYKGKGVRYADERVVTKEAKKK